MTISNATTFELQGSQKKKIRRKGMRIFFFFFGTPSRLFAQKIFEEIIVESFLNMEKEIVTQVQEAQSPIQDKPKEKHTKTHTNQTNKA